MAAVDTSPKIKNKPARRAAQLEAFERWYAAYPRHEAKDRALKAWLKRNPDGALNDAIMTATAAYVAAKADTEQCYIKLPATWLNDGCWKDELEKAADGGQDEQWRRRTFING
jgi:hypothetical protein